MGTVIAFPAERPARASLSEPRGDEAIVVILPVIRIERYDDEPTGAAPDATSPRGRRRKR